MRPAIQIVAFEPDLLFSSRVESVSHKIGVDLTIITHFENLLQTLRETTPAALLLSLDALDEKLDGLQNFVNQKSCPVIGYYSHVNIRLVEEAKRIGVKTVLSRGAFVARIEQVLNEIFYST